MHKAAKKGVVNPESLLLAVDEAAEILTCSIRSVWRLIGEGHLSVVRIGRSVRVTRASVMSFIDHGGERDI